MCSQKFEMVLSNSDAQWMRDGLFFLVALLLVCAAGTGVAAVGDTVDIADGNITITESGYMVGPSYTAWTGDPALMIRGTSQTNNIIVTNGSCTLTLSDVNMTPPDVPAISVCAGEEGR